MTINSIILREVFDSRGAWTIEAEVSSGKTTKSAIAPSGASIGKHEVPAFPVGGTSSAIKEFNTKLKEKLIGAEVDYHKIDAIIQEYDPERKKLGGNISTALSLTIAKLQAALAGKEFYGIFGSSNTLPFPLGNVIGGGVHGGKGSPMLQEFLSIPVGAKSFKDAALANSMVHKKVEEELNKNPNFTRGRDDEGAWAPEVSNQGALELLSSACDRVSDIVGFEVRFGLDVAASEFWDAKQEKYVFRNNTSSREEHISFMQGLVDKYNIYYLEDPLEEDDFNGFAELNKSLGSKCLVVGDDLIVTNLERLETSIKKESCNSLIVKPNQVGSLSETEKVINRAVESSYTPVISHRSGESCDSSIAHIAVGFSIPIIKTGIVGGERTAKLNELIRIEEKSKIKIAKL